MIGHLKVDYDPWLLRSEKQKFDEDEIKNKAHQSINSEDKVEGFKDITPKKRPIWYSSKYTTVDADFEPIFDNDDSLKVKFGSNKVLEATFLMRNLTLDNTKDQEGNKSSNKFKNIKFIFRKSSKKALPLLSFSIAFKFETKKRNVFHQNIFFICYACKIFYFCFACIYNLISL